MSKSKTIQRKVYVEEPVLDDSLEEDEYRYVNSRISDAPTNDDDSLIDDIDSNRYVNGGQSLADTNSTGKPQFVLRHSATHKGKSQKEQDLNRNGSSDSGTDMLSDAELLEQEKYYQKHLKNKLQEETKNNFGSLVPRLNLSGSSDEENIIPRDSLDIGLMDDTYRSSENNDSLDADKDSLEEGESGKFSVDSITKDWKDPPKNPFHMGEPSLAQGRHREYQEPPLPGYSTNYQNTDSDFTPSMRGQVVPPREQGLLHQQVPSQNEPTAPNDLREEYYGGNRNGGGDKETFQQYPNNGYGQTGPSRNNDGRYPEPHGQRGRQHVAPPRAEQVNQTYNDQQYYDGGNNHFHTQQPNINPHHNAHGNYGKDISMREMNNRTDDQIQPHFHGYSQGYDRQDNYYGNEVHNKGHQQQYRQYEQYEPLPPSHQPMQKNNDSRPLRTEQEYRDLLIQAQPSQNVRSGQDRPEEYQNFSGHHPSMPHGFVQNRQMEGYADMQNSHPRPPQEYEGQQGQYQESYSNVAQDRPQYNQRIPVMQAPQHASYHDSVQNSHKPPRPPRDHPGPDQGRNIPNNPHHYEVRPGPQPGRNNEFPNNQHHYEGVERDHGTGIPQSVPNRTAPMVKQETDENGYEEMGDFDGIVSLKESPRNQSDFIEKNKQIAVGVAPREARRTYGQLHSMKKQKPVLSPGGSRGRPPIPGSGVSVRSTQSEKLPRKRDQDGFASRKPASAEDLWSQRSKSLSSHKREKLSGNKSMKGSPLKKYPSESRVNDIQATKPHFVEPLPPRPPQAPRQIRSEYPREPAGYGYEAEGPAQRGAWREEPMERVSIVANPQVLSPAPDKPIGPIVPRQRPSGPIQQRYNQDPVPNHRNTRPEQRNSIDYSGREVLGNVQGGDQRPMQYNYQQPAARDNIQYGYPTEEEYMGMRESIPPHPPHPPPPPPQVPSSLQQSQAPITSPYQVIPPINTPPKRPAKAQEEQQTTHDKVGYGDQFRKQKEKKQPEYKPYTLKDYKKITKSSPRTGGLGPDMDNDILREKAEKRQRQLEFARKASERNRSEFAVKKPPKPRPPTEKEKENEEQLKKRKAAMEYAKGVRHRARTRTAERQSTGQSSARSNGSLDSSRSLESQQGHDAPELVDLDTLRQRHERDKQAAANIRHTLHSSAAQAT